jgi:hypothetical protein
MKKERGGKEKKVCEGKSEKSENRNPALNQNNFQRIESKPSIINNTHNNKAGAVMVA